MVKKGTFRLQVGDKEVVRESELLEHATLYYKTLFGHSITSSLQLDYNLWLEEEEKMALDNEVLRRTFDEEEIHSAIFQIKRTRMGCLLNFINLVGISLRLICCFCLSCFILGG
jgi:hypothetical protein